MIEGETGAPPGGRPARGAPRLLLATNNPGKVRELRALLADSGWQAVTPAEIGLDLDVTESGSSYAENARLKARAYGAASGLPALGEDSGLEVDALDGQPGPRHHALGWDGAGDAERIAILLDRLRGVATRRAARFRSAVVVCFPDGTELAGEGVCEGAIAARARGKGGFGYDPVFLLPESGRTMAQLRAAEKNRISHRARAIASLADGLRAKAAYEAAAPP